MFIPFDLDDEVFLRYNIDQMLFLCFPPTFIVLPLFVFKIEISSYFKVALEQNRL